MKVIVVFPSTVTIETDTKSPLYRSMLLYATMVIKGGRENLIKYRYTIHTLESAGLGDVKYEKISKVVQDVAFKGI